MKPVEDLLREVLHDPAYDLTPEGDPLAPVWTKARTIRRRRALTAAGTVVVVLAAAAVTGIAIIRPEARTNGVVHQPTASVTPTPPPIGPAPYGSVPLAMTDPIAVDQEGVRAVLGVQQATSSFRVVRFDVDTGIVRHSDAMPGKAGALAADGEVVWVPAVGTHTMHRLGLDSLTALPDTTDPRGVLLGPNVATRYGAWASDTQGLSLFLPDGTSTRGDAWRGTVCDLQPIAQARNGFSDEPVSDAFLASTSDAGLPCGDLRIGTGPNALGGRRSSPVMVAADASLGIGDVAGRTAADGTTQIWVAQPTGTMGFAQRYTLPASGEPVVRAGSRISGSNQLRISLAGGIAWLSDPGSLACAGSNGDEAWREDLPPADGPTHVFDFSGRWVTVDLSAVRAFDPSPCPAAG
jgi:hypothetical protein